MNLILLFPEDFVDRERVSVTGRRAEHAAAVHRAAPGRELVVGLADGAIGKGEVVSLEAGRLEMRVTLNTPPPPPMPLTLILAVPRPKVLNRVIAGAASLGIKRIFLINAWRVEKSYWSSPRMSAENLRQQSILGLEQARDTILPQMEVRRFFRRFVEDELPALAHDTLALVAHPGASAPCPRHAGRAVTLAVGPEGGFIDAEIASLERAGFTPVALGPRILRVETAVAALASRLF